MEFPSGTALLIINEINYFQILKDQNSSMDHGQVKMST